MDASNRARKQPQCGPWSRSPRPDAHADGIEHPNRAKDGALPPRSFRRGARRHVERDGCATVQGNRTAPPKLALSISEACEALGVGWDLWHEQIEPEIRLVRLGRRKLVPISELHAWLERHAARALEKER